MQSRQADIFDYSIRTTVDDILNGYNGTVFAYGQTGSGKSFTMMGTDIDDDGMKGIIPRIVEQIFASIGASPPTIEYTVAVSYMEIYMEQIRDLLRPENSNLPVHEDKTRGVYVKGLEEFYVSSVPEVYNVMRVGGSARMVASTKMNAESSRSHSIFVITVTQKDTERGSAKSGQLFLVDLAGSEKVGKTGASGQTLEEAKKINKSLSALGMVINALTDGKSTHVPYRDSKLTRILQESLGGNSRTTLIICCSPSSFNADETISTLRFGERAKRIQNKAKINAELSPTELKALLKKSQAQMSVHEDYMSALEGEVGLWRGGESVPKERWTPARHQASALAKRTDLRPSVMTPSRPMSYDSKRPDTPTGWSDIKSDMERSSTPSIILEKDEREEFLRRENELQDILAERENAVAKAEEELRQAKVELDAVRRQQKQALNENERLQGDVNEFRLQIERIQFEGKEGSIQLDALRELNTDLTNELDEVKQRLVDTQIIISQTSAAIDEKEKKKAERMAEMMAGFSVDGESVGAHEQSVTSVIEELDGLLTASSTGDLVSPEELQSLKQKLLTTQTAVRQVDRTMAHYDSQEKAMHQRREALESQLASVEKEYEELLERNLTGADIEEVKRRLGDAYINRQSANSDITADHNADLANAMEANQKLKDELDAVKRQLKSSPAVNGSHSGKTLQQQIADFDAMKKSLMRDLQNRCERVVELEISLDETREQYNNVLRTSNNRAQQKKMAFLERNLEQLTHVQRQLVEQNSSLKKECAIAERKLGARNERIQSLEALLGDSQEKLMAANHKCVAPQLILPAYKNTTDNVSLLQIRNATSSCPRPARSRKSQ
jgi:kinesin family protein 5